MNKEVSVELIRPFADKLFGDKTPNVERLTKLHNSLFAEKQKVVLFNMDKKWELHWDMSISGSTVAETVLLFPEHFHGLQKENERDRYSFGILKIGDEYNTVTEKYGDFYQITELVAFLLMLNYAYGEGSMLEALGFVNTWDKADSLVSPNQMAQHIAHFLYLWETYSAWLEKQPKNVDLRGPSNYPASL